MTGNIDATRQGTGLIRALHVTGPVGEHADKLMLFGRYVGSWHLEWTGRNRHWPSTARPSGSTTRRSTPGAPPGSSR